MKYEIKYEIWNKKINEMTYKKKKKTKEKKIILEKRNMIIAVKVVVSK